MNEDSFAPVCVWGASEVPVVTADEEVFPNWYLPGRETPVSHYPLYPICVSVLWSISIIPPSIGLIGVLKLAICLY